MTLCLFYNFPPVSLSLSLHINCTVSMYGKFTAANDLYKEIMIDASTFVNDGNILATGDQINLIHNNALEDSSYYNRWLFHSVFQSMSRNISLRSF